MYQCQAIVLYQELHAVREESATVCLCYPVSETNLSSVALIVVLDQDPCVLFVCSQESAVHELRCRCRYF